MQWGGGGGGGSGAIANAAAAIATGQAECVVVVPSTRAGPVRPVRPGPAQPQRLGRGGPHPPVRAHVARADVRHEGEPVHARPRCRAERAARDLARLLRARADTTRAPSCTGGRSTRRRTTRRAGSSSRSTSTTVARRTTARPRSCSYRPNGPATSTTPRCYVLAAVSGSHHRAEAPVHNTPDYASSSFTTVAPRLYRMAGLGPADVDVLQSYENFTGGVLMSIVEHGFCTADEANDFFTLDNLLAPSGSAAAQHERRQSRRVLHARPRSEHRGDPPDLGRIHVPGAAGRRSRWSARDPWSARSARASSAGEATL